VIILNIIRRKSIFELLLIITALTTVAIGEVLNLLVYKATAYTDKIGIPIYIILAGSILAWSYFKLPQILSEKLKKNNLFIQLVLFLFLSTFFPVIEIAGIKAGLWYWLKPYSITSLWWWIGVWKFYMIFLGIPILTAFLIFSVKEYLENK
jgi:hypothetical protein